MKAKPALTITVPGRPRPIAVVRPRVLNTPLAGCYIDRSDVWMRKRRDADKKLVSKGKQPLGPRWIERRLPGSDRTTYGYLIEDLDDFVNQERRDSAVNWPIPPHQIGGDAE